MVGGEEVRRELRRLLRVGLRVLVLAFLQQLVRDLQHRVVMAGRGTQLATELIQPGLGLVAHEEDAVRVVHVGGVGIAGDQLLEGEPARGRGAALGLVEAGPARHQDHLAPVRGDLARQQGHAEDAETEGLDHPLRVLVLAGEVAQHLEGQLVLLEAVEEDREVVAGDRHDVGARDAQIARGLQLLEGAVVVLELELAEPLQRQHEANLGVGLHEPPELVTGLLEAVVVVEERTEEESALEPAGLQLECFAVMLDRLVVAAGLPGRLGLLRDRVERRGRPGFGPRRRDGRRARGERRGDHPDRDHGFTAGARASPGPGWRACCSWNSFATMAFSLSARSCFLSR